MPFPVSSMMPLAIKAVAALKMSSFWNSVHRPALFQKTCRITCSPGNLVKRAPVGT